MSRISKINQVKEIEKERFSRWTSSKQKLDLLGHLIVVFDLVDTDGNKSRQVGEATQSNMKKRFSIAFDQAFLNAVYKHFSYHNKPIPKTPDNNTTDLISSSRVVKWNIRYYTDFDKEDKKPPTTIKNFTMRGKRYTDVRYKGRLISRARYEAIKDDEIETLIEERTQSFDTE